MKLCFHASQKKPAQDALADLLKHHENHKAEDADYIVVLGGDGTMLHALHKYVDLDKNFYGMNLGTLGFLHNDYKSADLEARIEAANGFQIHPLRMIAKDINGEEFSLLAFNEVSLLRQTHKAAKIKIEINAEERISELVCDGIMVSTPMGSTAYNSSAGGPIIPLDANVLPITPISAFRPRRWPGALISNSCEIVLDILKAKDRGVSVTADSTEIRDIQSVEIRESRSIQKTLLFDPDNPLEERIFQEQFAPGC